MSWPIFARVAQAEKEIKKLIETPTFPDSGPGLEQALACDALGNCYLGGVTSPQLISGNDLASELSLTAGTSFNSDAGWLKYYYVGDDGTIGQDGTICFVARRPFRYNLSWVDIYNVGAVGPLADAPNGSVDQDAEIELNGMAYRVRLLTGGTKESEGYGSNEWNTVMYSVVNCVDDGILGAAWAQFSNDFVGIGGQSNPNGRRSWCQETDPGDSARRVCRGILRVSYFYSHTADISDTSIGWRPVLELVSS